MVRAVEPRVSIPERAKSLKKRVLVKAEMAARRGYEVQDEGKAFREGVKLCIERPRLLTESYKQTEGQPMILRRAKALDHILSNMTIYIQPDEILVGNFASDPQSVTHYPELQWRWLEKELRAGYKDILDEEGKEELSRIHKYWKPISIHGRERDLIPDDVKPYWRFAGAMMWAYQWEMSTPNYEKIFRIGLKGHIDEVRERRKRLEDDFHELRVRGKQYLEGKAFLDAAEIALNAAINWGKRYADLAASMAEAEADPGRKQELEGIVETCNRVPGDPPRTFHEAMQCFILIHYLITLIEGPKVGCGARFDVIFRPFYEKDIAEGKFTREDALGLTELMMVKFLETGFIHPPMWSGGGGGGLGWQTLNIGGVDAQGNDITNDLSYLLLDATKDLHSIQPPLGLRWHKGTPKELLSAAIDVTAAGVAQPAFFNDEVIIPRFVEMGATLEDARGYSDNTCMYEIIPGKNMRQRVSSTGILMVPKCFEFALTQGKHMINDEQYSIVTPDPTTFNSLDDVIEAFIAHFRFFVDKLIKIGAVADALYEEWFPLPLTSALLDDCIERMEDSFKWRYVPYTEFVPTGITNTADALAAIQKLVFEEKKVTMTELLKALKANWEGYEELRQMCLAVPKWGNDDDFVDTITANLYFRLSEEVAKFKGFAGEPCRMDGSQAAVPWAYSGLTAATPDGRRYGDPFSDGTIGPIPGRDKSGPTALLKSVSKVNMAKSFNHLLNQSFQPEFLSGPYREMFVDYLRTWGELGIHHIQFNAVSEETLRDAQLHPEHHSDLVVRVAGYSAYFVDLSEGIQNFVIARSQGTLA